MAEVKESSNTEAKQTVVEEPKTERETNARMKPWEQHAGVISIPRYDYNAPSALMNHSHSGFLITCSIKREKSATKEAMSILEKYVGSHTNWCSESFESCNANNNKRRKIFTDEVHVKCGELVQSKSLVEDADGLDGRYGEGMQNKSLIEETGGLSKNDFPSSGKTDATVDTDVTLSLVKLSRSGLLLLTFPRENSPDTVDIVSNIFQSLEAGTLRTPLWCHRIFPIQVTCCLNEKELRAVVSKLVLQFMNGNQQKLARPLKFAVGYNRRGIEETQVKGVKDTSTDSDLYPLLDRCKCFDVVASAVKCAVSDSVVDLKSPDLSVLVELLPVSGASNRSFVAAISVLPQNLVSTKPRLSVRPLVSDAKVSRNSKRTN